MNSNCEDIVQDFVHLLLKQYPEPQNIRTIVQTGSSLTQPLDDCLDVDFIMFVDDNNASGSIFADIGGLRAECNVVPIEGATLLATNELRKQSSSLAYMILSGRAIWGNSEILAKIQEEVEQLLRKAKPFFVPDAMAFAGYGLLNALRRSRRHEDMVYLSLCVVDFFGRNYGPQNGTWPIGSKGALRQISADAGLGGASLFEAVRDCSAGDPSRLITLLDSWLIQHNVPRRETFNMLRPKTLFQSAS